MKRNFLAVLAVLSTFVLQAQPQSWSSSEILHEMVKLQTPARVLYVAAHPDDENTRMISWLSNGVGANTAYLSLTRGDGGQNLIGTELGAKLGVLRTQELMQARRIDGGTQFFSRAVDFGYSKTADETMEKWGEEEILSDVVYVIRKFRPEFIITRFPPEAYGGHGHHTASAILAMKAFDLAADENAFPDQLKYVETWQSKSLYWNASTWWNPKLDSIAQADDDYIRVEVGGYNPLLGKSYNELASFSRTQHKSQGFGVSVARGAQAEYLKYLKGERIENGTFEYELDQIGRKGDEEAKKILKVVISQYDIQNPEKSIENLMIVRRLSYQIRDAKERDYFQSKLDQIIQSALGIYAELLTEKEYYSVGNEIPAKLEIINRSGSAVKIVSLKVGEANFELGESLYENETLEKSIDLKSAQDLSNPYWLRSYYENLFQVAQPEIIGQPEDFATVRGILGVKIGDQRLNLELPLRHKYSDRVEGEINEPVYIMPKITVNAQQSNLIFTENEPQNLALKVRFFDKKSQNIYLKAKGWKIEPDSITVSPSENSETKEIVVSISPNSNAENVSLKIENSEGKQLQSLSEISYPHIDSRIVLQPAELKLVKLDLQKKGEKIAYISGAGDKVAEAIQRMGYQVDILNEADLAKSDLSQYQTVVAGIRAYNTQKWLPAYREKLMNYVEEGGNYVVQYNTRSRDLLTTEIGPFPFEISRERVTEEDAEVEFLEKKHPILNKPNKLSDRDFKGWVQERGLYFAGTWDDKYQTPLGWHDEGEPTRKGGLIVADYGDGSFIYTGISFFRELPAGVPGAYRLLANILSYQNPAQGGTQ